MTVAIVPYRESWASDFLQLRDQLDGALQDTAVCIDHIGSTSIRGLPAKDVIDVQVTVRELSPEIASRLSRAGFVQHLGAVCDHIPPGQPNEASDWEKLLFKERLGERRANIHIRQQGRPNQRFAILMRDFLRAHPHFAQAYATLKSRLVSALRDPRDYAVTKDPAVDLIYLAAEDWASHGFWSPG